jgi:hypothetical protein
MGKQVSVCPVSHMYVRIPVSSPVQKQCETCFIHQESVQQIENFLATYNASRLSNYTKKLFIRSAVSHSKIRKIPESPYMFKIILLCTVRNKIVLNPSPRQGTEGYTVYGSRFISNKLFYALNKLVEMIRGKFYQKLGKLSFSFCWICLKENQHYSPCWLRKFPSLNMFQTTSGQCSDGYTHCVCRESMTLCVDPCTEDS